MKSLGIDVGGTSAKLAMFNGSATAWTGQSGFYSRPDTDRLILALQEAAAGRFADADVVGICVPGLLDRPRRMVTLSVNVPGLMNVPLDELVARALGREVGELRIVNDAVATGADVIQELGLTGRVCSIALGTGVGMGVFDDGIPLQIEGASSGHIGQFDVSLDDAAPIGPDNGRGSLEGYIGVPAIERAYGSTERFLASATVTDAPLRALARAVRICHAIYRPRHVVLVGGIGTRLRRLANDLYRSINDHLTRVADPGWKLHFGTSDFHAARGAARVAAREFAQT
jgi:predicted NBD/HSP70 family sugar kinase